ncbi:MAG: type 1 glutamine amidotransferase domain-containing protein [Cyanobacteria bacterium J06627_28]
MDTSSKQILMVVANPSVSTTLGWPVGFWASELIHPYHKFIQQGYDITIASPEGGKVEFDGFSDPRDESGYSKDDTLSLEYINKPDFMAKLEDTPSVKDVKADEFDAIVVCGGQSPMFTFETAEGLQETFLSFYKAQKPSAALCHGTALLLYLKDDAGEPIIAGKKMTGFANSEEDYGDSVVGQKMMPFRIEDEAKKLDANFVTAEAFSAYALQDGNLITGQQQNSGAAVAELVIAALGA